MANTLPTNNERRFFRDFRHFNENAFHQDLLAVDFKSLISTDVNESVTTSERYHRPSCSFAQSIKTATKAFRKALDFESNHALNQTKTQISKD